MRHRPANLRARAPDPAAREAQRSGRGAPATPNPPDFRALADHALVGIFVTTCDGEWRYANEALAQLLEYASPAALMQQNVRELYQQPTARDALLTRLRRGEPVRNAELELRTQGGALRTVLASMTLEGNQLSGMLIDITERTRAEQQANVTLETYRVLFETLPVGVTITDQEGQIRETNPAAVAILRLPTAEHTQRALSSPVWQVIRPDGSPMPVEEFAGVRALREQRQVRDVEMGVIAAAGQVSWISVTAAPLPIPGQGAVIVYQDISAHKQAARIGERYQLLAARARDIVLFVRPDGRIVEANAAAVAAYGYDHDTLCTMQISDLRDPATHLQVASQMAEADQVGILFETVHRRKDGTTFPVEVSSVGAALGHERLLLSIIRDTSERTETAAAQARLTAQLAQERALLAAVLQQLPVGVGIASAPDGKLLRSNAQLQTIWPDPWLPAEGIAGIRAYRGFHPDGRPYQPEEWPLARAIRTGEVVPPELIPCERGDGTRRMLEVRATPARDDTGQIIAGVVTVVDVSTRERAAQGQLFLVEASTL
ncbi:MAG: PAS domain S-box protein, partial [Chloroflexales bacterium]|nr:PAS domain S-box protein [Chloroflexales bacterium]